MPGSLADTARAKGDALMDEQMEHVDDYERRQALIDQAQRAYERGFAPPQLTPKKREPDTYCFRCGAPVPGGLFITNSRKGGRNFSWVNVDGMTWRTEGAHVCPTADEQAGPLFAPREPERPDVERELIHKYATTERDLEEGLELLTTEDLVDHLAFAIGELENSVKHARGDEDRKQWQEALDDTIADAERLLEPHTTRQLELAI